MFYKKKLFSNNWFYLFLNNYREADQILYDDMKSSKSIESLKNQPLDETKPGLGQYYCIPCARYFDSVSAKNTHMKGRFHKRQVKELKEGPYTQEEANFAAGHNVQKFLQKRKEREELVKSEEVLKVLDAKPEVPVTIENKDETEEVEMKTED